MASVGVLKKSKKRKGRDDDRKWNPVNPITPAEKARAVIGSLVKILHQV